MLKIYDEYSTDRPPSEIYWNKPINKTELELHKGETKYGDHWYKSTDMIVNPLDRFADAYYTSVNDIMWAGRNAEWIFYETVDFWTFW